MPGWVVKGTYGLAVGYVVSDVSYHVYLENALPDTVEKSIPRCIIYNTVFQLVASLALPVRPT